MLKLLWAHTKGYRPATILGPVCVGLECVMELIVPMFMGKFVDNGVDKGNMAYAWKMALLILGFIVVALFLGVLSSRLSAVASSGLSRNLRKAEFEKIQGFSFGNIDKFSTSSLVTRLTTDVNNMQLAFMMLSRMAVRAPLNMIISLVMAFIISPKMSVIFLAAIPVLAIVILSLSKKARPVFEKLFKFYDRLNRVVQENVRGIRVVKSFVRGDHEIEKFTSTTRDIYETNTRAEKILSWNAPTLQFCMYTCNLAICYFGARSIVLGNMTSGNLMSLISYVMSCLMALNMLSMLWVMITMSRASVQRITEVLREESTLHNPDEPVMEVRDGSVSFRDASFGYREGADVLHGLTVDIPSGATAGIIGGTGCGKTSMAQLIPRLYDVSGGAVYVGGVDVRDYDIETLRDQVAMVLQKNVLFSGTVRSNMLWGNPGATDEEIRHACRLAQADEFISGMELGYDSPVEQGGTNFSGGQRQRLCIARALLKKPKILILDDSTSAVDTRTDALIRQAFMEEIPNTTKIIIAQRISSVIDTDIIIVLDEGKIVDYGKHAELLERCGIYREVYESQQKGVSRIAG